MRNAALVFIIALSTPVHAAVWPVDATPKVVSNFGVLQNNIWHLGIDIPGPARCKAVGKGTLTDSFIFNGAYVLRFDPDGSTQDIGYGHIFPLKPNDPNYVSLVAKDFFAGIAGTTLTEGQIFASTSSVGVAFNHVHVNIIDGFDKCANPLLSPLISNNDPGNTKPKIGPIFIRRDGGDYLHSVPLWGKVKVFAEITDKQNTQIDAQGLVSDPDAWTSGDRYHGTISVPYRVTFSVEQNGTNFRPENAFTTNIYPKVSELDRIMLKSKRVSGITGINKIKYHYVYNLTALEDGPSVWNTLTTEGNPLDGNATARLNSEAHFKDGQYTVKIHAADVAGHAADKEVPVVLDNFAPFLRWDSTFHNRLLQIAPRVTLIA